MIFVSISKLEEDLVNKISIIPKDIDLVVGVPRSGMLVASLVALQLNVSLTDLESFMNGRIYSSGFTKCQDKIVRDMASVKRILVVEDSVCNGNSINNVKHLLLNSNIEVLYFAAYVTPKGKRMVDFYLDVIDFPRIFEWNYLHNSLLEYACCDIDGVLCDDPLPKDNDDGANYSQFVLNASPKLIPTATIGWIVTSRLEKYRNDTEKWLRKNGIKYKHLIMLNMSSAEERRELGIHAKFKSEIYGQLPQALWFIESNSSQAHDIAVQTGKPVFCIEDHFWYDGTLKNNVKAKFIYNSPKTLKEFIKSVIPKPVKRIIKKCIKH